MRSIRDAIGVPIWWIWRRRAGGIEGGTPTNLEPACPKSERSLR